MGVGFHGPGGLDPRGKVSSVASGHLLRLLLLLWLCQVITLNWVDFIDIWMMHTHLVKAEDEEGDDSQ